MVKTSCGKGHIYDSEIYGACPYCNSTLPSINFEENVFGGTRVTDDNKTMPPTGYFSGDNNVTMPPDGISVGANNVTQPPASYKQKSAVDDNVTMAAFEQKIGISPVVGWFVCTDGPDKGKDYKIYGKINNIGRGRENDIVIKGDNTISNLKHIKVGYTEKTNRFTLVPGEGKNIVFVNGEELYVPKELKAYDEIDFGTTKLRFIPFCSDKFVWEKR